MYEYAAVVSGIVDDDTIDLRVDVGFNVWLCDRFRLLGIAAPELRQP